MISHGDSPYPQCFTGPTVFHPNNYILGGGGDFHVRGKGCIVTSDRATRVCYSTLPQRWEWGFWDASGLVLSSLFLAKGQLLLLVVFEP